MPPSSWSRRCVALLTISTGACTITTVDTSDGGAAATSTTSTSAGSAGSAGSATTGGTAGAAGNSGSGGSAGAGGGTNPDGGTIVPEGGGTDAPVPSDPCNDGGTEITPNDDRDHATAYPLGVPVHACLQSPADIDFDQFTAPASPAQGGYVKVQLTDVGQDGSIEGHIFAAHDNGEFESSYNATSGGSVFFFFAAKAGATFRLRVNRFAGVDKPTAYLLTATFYPVSDDNEPNDDNAHATPIMVGKALNGYLFAGHEDSTAPSAAAWEDRFKVTLPAGDVTIGLSNLGRDISGQVKLYNATGSQIASAYDATQGSSVSLKHTVTAAEAGECFILVEPFSGNVTSGDGSTLPAFWTQPYSLLVTTP